MKEKSILYKNIYACGPFGNQTGNRMVKDFKKSDTNMFGF
jgi:hypothetical protein